MVHWNIYDLFLFQEDYQEAGRALESYVYKYPDNEFQVYEAYDKLSVFAVDAEDWGRVLYYADKILEKDPERYPLILTKARAMIRLGEKKEGKALLERIVKEAEGTVQYNLALMELDELIAAKDIKDPPIDPEEERKTEGGDEGGKQDLLPVAVVQDPLLVEKYRKTLDSIRYAVTAIQVYQLDEMKLPGKLADLVPIFIKEEQLWMPGETRSTIKSTPKTTHSGWPVAEVTASFRDSTRRASSSNSTDRTSSLMILILSFNPISADRV